jgi:hypothetical protein
MEFNLRVVQLEEDLVRVINESGLPSTVVNLLVQKVSNNINMSVNMQIAQHKEDILTEVPNVDDKINLAGGKINE